VFVQTHKALAPNCLMLAAQIFFLVLMASGIYKHNPGPRAFRIMYREVRIFLSPCSCTSEAGDLSSQGMLWLVAAMLVEIVPTVSRVHSLLCVDGSHSL
jgi:hypothetical protein